MQGHSPSGTGVDYNDIIRVDQGLDTNQIAPTIGLDTDLRETAYIVEMDYRLGRIKKANGTHDVAAVNFIDDDNIATYYLTGNDWIDHFKVPSNNTLALTDPDINTNPQVFAGPRGSTLHFRIHASAELQHSTYLFEQLGNSETANHSDTPGNMMGFGSGETNLNNIKTYSIDTTVRVIGANTGFRLDIPVRYVKIQ